MSEKSFEELRHAVRQLTQLSGALLDALERERRALVERSLTALSSATAEKAELCAAIERAGADLGPTPLRQQIAVLPEAQRSTLEPEHEALSALVRETRDCNTVNGKVLRRSQQSVRELMHLMSGTDSDVVYSEHGYTPQGKPLAGSQGSAIAKA